jgi:hypothetical protein
MMSSPWPHLAGLVPVIDAVSIQQFGFGISTNGRAREPARHERNA